MNTSQANSTIRGRHDVQNKQPLNAVTTLSDGWRIKMNNFSDNVPGNKCLFLSEEKDIYGRKFQQPSIWWTFFLNKTIILAPNRAISWWKLLLLQFIEGLQQFILTVSVQL